MPWNKYPYTDNHELNLDWFLSQFKDLLAAWTDLQTAWTAYRDDLTVQWGEVDAAWQTYKTYIDDYFANLNVQTEINAKIDSMVTSGEFLNVISPTVVLQTTAETSSWLAEHIAQETGYVLDTSLTVAGAAADAKATGDAVTDVKCELSEVEKALLINPINWYNPELVTSETVTYDSIIDGMGELIELSGWAVSPFLPIDKNTEYTAGFVPAYGSALAPWFNAGIAIVVFDKNKTRIQSFAGNSSYRTFTTNSDAKYYRFNIATSAGINLSILNDRFMLVKGSTLPSTFTAYLAPKILNAPPIFYTISNDILTVKSAYGSEEITVTFGRRGPNNLPDYRSITIGDMTKYNGGTDWFGPFKIAAINDINGDDISNHYFTGGNHNYNNTGDITGAPTARNLSLEYYADGDNAQNEGYAHTIKIVWINRVQAYNTRKQDGTGREVLEERHTLLFDGNAWEAYTEIEPLEDVVIETYYGYQCSVSTYGTIYMIGSDYRKPFLYTNPHASGNAYPNIYVAHDSTDRLEMEVDRTVDMGRGSLYGSNGSQGFFTSGSKGYCYLVYNKTIDANDVYGVRGWYRFLPQFNQ